MPATASSADADVDTDDAHVVAPALFLLLPLLLGNRYTIVSPVSAVSALIPLPMTRSFSADAPASVNVPAATTVTASALAALTALVDLNLLLLLHLLQVLLPLLILSCSYSCRYP